MSDDEMFEPKFLRRNNSGWLAVSPDGAWIRIGVEAWSADDARNRFHRALREWIKLRDMPDPLPSSAPSDQT